MINGKTFWFGLVAAAALAMAGCGDSSSGGMGGMGGMAGGMAMVNAAHLAPAFPDAEDTSVAIFVDGTEVPGVSITYGTQTGRVPLPAGTYDIGLGVPGGTPALTLEGVELAAGDDITAVAYATSVSPGVAVFVFSNGTDGLEEGFGRVNVAHGANDAALDPVNIVTTDALEPTECTDLIPGFEFGTQVPAPGADPLDVDADQLLVAFDLGDECPPATLGPVAVPVTDDVVSIVVAVDEDPTDGLDVELWAIVDASGDEDGNPIPLINATPAPN